MAIAVPAVGDQGTAAWADSVANGINNAYIGDNTNATAVTLTTNALTAGGASVTVTLTQTTRVRVFTQAMFTMLSGTNGRYAIRSVFNTGAAVSIGTATQVGNSGAVLSAAVLTGTQGAVTASTEGVVTLAAGTYTFSVGVQRASGGGTGDTATNCYVQAEVVGLA